MNTNNQILLENLSIYFKSAEKQIDYADYELNQEGIDTSKLKEAKKLLQEQFKETQKTLQEREN